MPFNDFFVRAKEYQRLWHQTQLDVKRLVFVEDDLLKEGVIDQWEKEFKILGKLYVQYINIINKVDECYDQMIHPQKRIFIRKLLDACLCRFLEVKHRMVSLSMEDNNFIDEICLNEKILPQYAEINVPKYFLRENKFVRKEREHKFRSLINHVPMRNNDLMSVKRAILIIQVHERTRQALGRYDNLHRTMKLRELGKFPSVFHDDGNVLTKSATIIQSRYRGFKCRKSYEEKKISVMKMMGMVPVEHNAFHAQKSHNEITILRHQIQRQHHARFIQAIPGDKVCQMLRKGRKIRSKFRKEARGWYRENVLLGKPKGFIFTPEEPPAITRVENELKSEKFKPKPLKVVQEKKKIEKSEPTKKELKSKKIIPEIIERPKLHRQLIWQTQEYRKLWQNKDESNNYFQVHDLGLIRARNYCRMKKELRKAMDDLMFIELQRLKDAVLNYRKGKRKGKKKKGKKKSKGKKGGKKKKKKQEKDLTADRSQDSLVEELIKNGIIKMYPKIFLSSFIGETSLVGQSMEMLGKKQSHCLGDVRRLIKEYCIIPLGSTFIHENSPEVKSVMIAGPRGSGKHTLVNAICTEIGAVLFDITTDNINSNYSDKSSLAMLMHMVNKVSRLLQPAVILVDNAEKTYAKKISKNDTSQPRRLSKVLPKLVKGIGRKDCIMLIGISSSPFDAKQAGLNKVYKKFIYIPRPDYATLYKFWNDSLSCYKNVASKFDSHTMAKLCDGFSLADVITVMEKVLTRERILMMKYKPLNIKEFCDYLIEETPIYKTEEAKFLKWYSNCPLGKKKRNFLKKLELQKEAKSKTKGRN
ncbi:hypothetical protein J437_LFUL010926 [Ladona fulva]|uniref:ATPase AAA-type core domain-containing protein n=1 Tax=Ladona fulva TaxID=123851 RepID=A0A8K0KMR2_LADFU|nr:hypothetical protein J437_LFUL010926 [Ladona fulva]